MYRIYGKDETMKRMRPVDLQSGDFVVNLIYASCWDTKEEADKVCEHINEHNENMYFEVRKI